MAVIKQLLFLELLFLPDKISSKLKAVKHNMAKNRHVVKVVTIRSV